MNNRGGRQGGGRGKVRCERTIKVGPVLNAFPIKYNNRDSGMS